MTWNTCANGHDLTTPEAYTYDGLGRRHCRTCAIEFKVKDKGKGAHK